MSGEIKVTDKRMFTEDGTLREEYRHLDNEEAPSAEVQETPPEPPASGTEEREAAEPVETSAPGRAEPLGTAEAATLPSPGFLDIVGLLAEPAAIYLGDAPTPDGSTAENLPLARLHIDMLEVLRQKTVGNLGEDERSVLEDLIYRLRLRYVQKRG